MSRANFRPSIDPERHPAAFLRDRMRHSADLARFLSRLIRHADPAGAGLAARSAAHDARALCRLAVSVLAPNDPAGLTLDPRYIEPATYYTRAEFLAILTEPDDDHDDEPRDVGRTLAEQSEYSASLSSLRR